MIRRPPRSTLFSLHDALPIYLSGDPKRAPYEVLPRPPKCGLRRTRPAQERGATPGGWNGPRSEEHTSELQSQSNLVCRLLLEKKKKTTTDATSSNDLQKQLAS